MAKKETNAHLKQVFLSSLLELINHNPTKTFNYKQISKAIGIIDRDDKKLVISLLAELKEKGTLIEPEVGKYKLKPKKLNAEGYIDINSNGVGYVTVEGLAEDVYIAPRYLGHALQNDLVSIYIYPKKKNGRPEGEVVKVLTRHKTEFVGLVQINGKHAFLVPDDHKIPVDIYIPLTQLNEAKNGQKAIAVLEDWPKEAKNPFGKIKQVLGWPGENEAEMNAILAEYGFATEFPPQVEAAAEKIPFEISAQEIANRRDLRQVTTLTIDPFDAKDFDDALSCRLLENGHWEIGVHIADVSHYVTEGSVLDEEAYQRATSIYLVDRVIPMLPERLSNHICSLRPGEDKLCFSAIFELDEKGKLHGEWFGRTVIHSNKRFTYEEAQLVIETEDGPYKDEILLMDRLAKQMRAERFKKGAIAFEKAEVKFHLDETGRPTGVYIKEAKDANKLIEEFMLLANKKVSEFCGKPKARKPGRTYVYRVHDKPSPDKLSAFSSFASKFGYRLDISNDKKVATSLNGLMKDLHGAKEQNVLEQLAIRTMAKAKYSTENIGHYGLAFDYYSHFTSPIRRYPDIIAHRLLQHYLDGGASPDAESYELRCKHSTDMEIQASKAERDSIKYKQVEFMKDHVGEEFDGMISGLNDWGMFVEINENKCEGLIRLRELTDDYYDFDEKNYCVVGKRTGRTYQMGDTVRIRIKQADLIKKQLTFELVDSSTAASNKFEDEFGFHTKSSKNGKAESKKKVTRRR